MSGTSALRLDDLIALNDEIIALARAGVPLDRGLLSLSRELKGRLGAAAGDLGRRLESGESLENALSQSGTAGLTPAYAAVVEAGLRAGRLPVALEGVATVARRIGQLHRMMRLAMLYPLVLLGLSYTLLIVMLVYWIPLMADFYRGSALPVPVVLQGLEWLGANANPWALVPPLLLILWLAATWFAGQRQVRQASRTRSSWGRWVGVLRLGRLATFSEILGLLVEHQVPLDQSLSLAGRASGDARLATGSDEFADRLRKGVRPESIHELPGGVPPLLGWLVVNGRDSNVLAQSLKHQAENYRLRARQRADLLSIYLPLWLTAGVGGAAVGVYAAVVIGPWCHVLVTLSGQ